MLRTLNYICNDILFAPAMNNLGVYMTFREFYVFCNVLCIVLADRTALNVIGYDILP